MSIQTDAHGFIIGEKRLKEMAEGINHTQENTKKILSVLVEKMDQLRRESARGNDLQNDGLNRQNRSGRSSSASDTPPERIRRSVDASTDLVDTANRLLRQNQNRDNTSPDSAGGSSSVRERIERQRDSRGRFIGSGGGQNESKEIKSILGRFKGFMPNVNGVDAGGIDPTVDAVKELGSVVAPVGRVFGGMGARAISVFRGRAKKRRNDEVLPDEQVRANDTQERNDRQRNKLLQRLINLVAVSGSGQGGGLLGGLLGGRGRGGMLKGLMRKVPILGALLGGTALLGNWGGSSSGEKGQGIGSIVGMGIGGALGSFLGPVGTLGGGALGGYLGGIFGEKVGKWTESLEDESFSDIFKDALSGIFGGINSPFGAVRSAGNIFSGVTQAFGGGGASGGFGDGGDLPAPTKVGKLSADKVQSISRVANNVGIDPNDLASIISFETAGTFSPGVKNPFSSATGLIQKMGDGATKGGNYNDGSYYGMSRDQYASLSFDEQMKYVERYYKERGFDGKKKRSLADAYTAVTGYGYKAGSKAYEQNKVWDTDKDGYISKGEAVRSKNFQAHRKQWIQGAGKQSVGEAKGIPYSKEVINGGKSPTNAIKIPPIKPEVAKFKPPVTASTSKAPSDTGISQIVSDRSLAHVFAGSIGFDNHNA